MKKTSFALLLLALFVAGCAKTSQKNADASADSTMVAQDSIAAEADAVIGAIDSSSQEVDQLLQEL